MCHSHAFSIRLTHITYGRKITGPMEITTVNYLFYINIPYVGGVQKGLGINAKNPALVIFEIIKT